MSVYQHHTWFKHSYFFCVGSLSNMKMLHMHTRPALFHFSTAERFLTRAVTDPKNVSRCPRTLTSDHYCSDLWLPEASSHQTAVLGDLTASPKVVYQC